MNSFRLVGELRVIGRVPVVHSFRLIAGSGHCGTKWLATVLDAQQGVTAHHELRQHLYPGPWHEAVQRGPYHPVNGPYFDAIHEYLKDGDVYDGISWGVHEIPLVHKLQPVHEIIYLVRNPILQLHSLWTKSQVWRTIPLDHFLYKTWLRNAWQMDPQPPIYSRRDRWGKLCEIVRANFYGPRWLHLQGLPVSVYRLEDLTTNRRTLARFVSGLSDDEMRHWQERDINRKVKGNRDPAHIWSLWTDEQRRTFAEICSTAMDAYGYTWPDKVYV